MKFHDTTRIAALIAMAGTATAQVEYVTQNVFAGASGPTLVGTGSPQVEHGRVDVEFGPFTVTLSGGNRGIDVASPAVSRYSFEDLDGNPVFPAAEGVLLTAASENAPFGTDDNPIFPNTSFLSATEVDDGGFLDVRTFEVTGLLDPDDPSAGVQDNGDDIPDRNLELDHDFNFAYFPFADGWVAGHAFPDDTDANGPLTSIIADGIQLVQEGDFDTYDGSFAAVVDVPDLPADIASFMPGDFLLPGLINDTDLSQEIVGRYLLVLPQFENVHRDGLLFAVSPSGESQHVYPVWAHNEDDSYIAPYFEDIPAEKTLQLWVHDSNASSAGEEADAVSFVYVPFGTTYTPQGGGDAELLPMGAIEGFGNFEVAQGPAPQFIRTRTDGDNEALSWTEGDLIIPGFTPDNSTLIAIPQSGSVQSKDNNLTYQANDDGTGWKLQLRDGPPHNEDGLNAEYHAVAYMVIPDDSTLTPATPAEAAAARADLSFDEPIAARFEMESFTTANDRGSVNADPDAGFPAGREVRRVAGSDRYDFTFENKGDITTTLDGRIRVPLLGVTIPQATELGRFDLDEGALDLQTGDDTRVYKDFVEYAVTNFEERVIIESVNDGGEIESNFALVTFPLETGFPQQPEVPYVPAEETGFGEILPNTSTVIDVPGVSADEEGPIDIGAETSEGVLFARTSQNNQGISVVDIDEDRFEIRVIQPDSLVDPMDADQNPVTGIDTDDDRLGWVFLPYSAGFPSAQVNADASIENGTGSFSLTQTEITVDIINGDLSDSGEDRTYTGYNLSIPGIDSNTDGVLLLQSVGDPTEDALGGTYPIYAPADDGSFNIVVLDATDRDQAMDANILDPDADTLAPFMFAFIPFEGVDIPGGPCVAADLAMPFGLLDGADVNAFITAFGVGSASADLNDDQVVDGADVNAFITQFGAGCP